MPLCQLPTSFRADAALNRWDARLAGGILRDAFMDKGRLREGDGAVAVLG